MRGKRLTVRDAAERTGLSKTTLRELDQRGVFPTRRDYSGRRIYTEHDIQRLRVLAGLEDGAE